MASNRVVISICTLSHSHVWHHTSRLLPRFVEADLYQVYVPSQEVAEFKTISGPNVQVLSQESISQEYHSTLLKSVENQLNSGRFGWYAQQFHKLQALQASTADELVIWDADCVPLRPVELFSPQGLPIFMRAHSHHEPYFEMISRLLGLERVEDQSFVIPGFPIKKSWVEDFFEALSERHPGMTWYEAIIKSTDLRLQSGFSETETLGTWITNSYPDSWEYSDLAWKRRGQSRFGYAADFSTEELISLGSREKLDIITFENWDLPVKYSFRRRMLSLIRTSRLLTFLGGRNEASK